MKNWTLILILFTSFHLIAQNQFKITGGNVKISADVNIVLQNTKWINNSNFTASNGTIHLTGTATQTNSSIEGTNETNFYNLTINKSSNNAELNQNITVQNTLTLSDGNLELNSSNCTLDGSYTLNKGTYIQTSGTGTLNRTITTSATKTFPVGNNSCTPMTIKNDGTADVFSVRSTPEVLENGTSGNALTADVVDLTWFVTEAVAGGSDLTLTAQWNASDELTGFDRTQCYISHYTGGGWNGTAPSAATGSDPYSISRSGITSLSPFAVGSNGALPIELIDFYAFRAGENVRLEWTTATEINSDIFEIEHSTDAISFIKIGEMEAATFSNSELNYDFLHQNPHNAINYYRLKMRDLDGSFEYSEIRSIDFPSFQNLESLISVYPNPTSDILNIRLNENIEEGKIEMYNELGQKVLDSDLNHSSQNTISVRDFPSGVYFLNVKADGQNVIKRVFVFD